MVAVLCCCQVVLQKKGQIWERGVVRDTFLTFSREIVSVWIFRCETRFGRGWLCETRAAHSQERSFLGGDFDAKQDLEPDFVRLVLFSGHRAGTFPTSLFASLNGPVREVGKLQRGSCFA